MKYATGAETAPTRDSSERRAFEKPKGGCLVGANTAAVSASGLARIEIASGRLLQTEIFMATGLVVCGKSTDNMHGAWLTEGASDVHVYDQSDSIVIGWNVDHKNMKFTPLALVFGKKQGAAEVYMQLEGSKGQESPEYFTFTGRRLDLLADAMKQFLLRAEQIARNER